MTTPPPVARRTPWILHPAVALPVILALIVLVAVMTPEDVNGRAGDQRLTTYSHGASGASGLHDVSQRLGWRVRRRTTPRPSPGDTTAIQALLDPPVPMSAGDVHALLDVVRRGGALLYVKGGEGALADSLHVRLGDGWEYDSASTVKGPQDAGACPADVSPGLPLWLGTGPLFNSIRWTRPAPRDTVSFVAVDSRRPAGTRLSAAVGFPVGRGRIVIVADPDVLRNDVIRHCEWNLDVAAVRMLEYLSVSPGGRRSALVFDEYHQGYGLQPGTMRAIALYLGGTASGHVLAQLAIAGVILLLALGPRALPPREETRVERRSPLEHVDALARAYVQVGATRTATMRLLHGVRRRVRRRGRALGDRPDDEFLTEAEHREPALTSDVALVRRALAQPVTPRELETVGAALARIETSLTSSKS